MSLHSSSPFVADGVISPRQLHWCPHSLFWCLNPHIHAVEMNAKPNIGDAGSLASMLNSARNGALILRVLQVCTIGAALAQEPGLMSGQITCLGRLRHWLGNVVIGRTGPGSNNHGDKLCLRNAASERAESLRQAAATSIRGNSLRHLRQSHVRSAPRRILS